MGILTRHIRGSLLLIAAWLILSGDGYGQLPPVGIIDFYGIQKVPETDVRRVLRIHPGDDAIKVIEAANDTRQRLLSLPGVDDAAVNVVCCDSETGRSIVFVGIREKGVSALTFRRAPRGAARLPSEIVHLGDEFETAFQKSIESGNFSEDDSQGHALFGATEVQAIQKRLIALATPNVKILRRVLRESSDPKHRALAAQVIAYVQDKRSIVGDLTFGMSDPDGGTRNNSMRALLVLAKYARENPQMRITVPTIAFVRMLNSLVWTDRNKAAAALDTLTLTRDAPLIDEIKNVALNSLAEMARWKSRGHAETSFNILGRIAGYTEQRIRLLRLSGAYDSEVQLMLTRIRRRPATR